MLKKRLTLDMSQITYTFSTNLPQKVRKILKLEVGSRIGFFHDKEKKLVTIGTGGQHLLGSTKLTKTYNITIVEEARTVLQIDEPQKLAYIQEDDGRISIQKASSLLE